MILETGTIVPTSACYARLVGQALRLEVGESRRAVKTIMRWTGVSDRTARNWLSDTSGPSGYHLARLAARSDAVLETFLTMSGRGKQMLIADIDAVRVALVKASALVDVLVEAEPSRDAKI